MEDTDPRDQTDPIINGLPPTPRLQAHNEVEVKIKTEEESAITNIKEEEIADFVDGVYDKKVKEERLFGCKCSGCLQVIQPDELVMRALSSVYHTDCFRCDECGDRLEKGDEFILRDEKLYCSADFNIAEQKSDIDVFSSDENDFTSSTSPPTFEKRMSHDMSASGCKRPRTILTAQQRQDFKAAFEQTPKPCRKVREQLSKETGLSVRVVQVWFQNQRAKLKKMQRKTDDGLPIQDPLKKSSPKPSKKKKKGLTNGHKSMEALLPSSLSGGDFSLPHTNIKGEPFDNILDISSNFASQANLPNYYGHHSTAQQPLLGDARLLGNGSPPRTLHFPSHCTPGRLPPFSSSGHFQPHNGVLSPPPHGLPPNHYSGGSPSYPLPGHGLTSPGHPHGPPEQLHIMHHLMNSF